MYVEVGGEWNNSVEALFNEMLKVTSCHIAQSIPNLNPFDTEISVELFHSVEQPKVFIIRQIKSNVTSEQEKAQCFMVY
jgi:hypothetical protein